jgi:TonB-dependent SusC/RagA subfamily outer membrane receptor
VPDKNATLVFTFIGYVTKEVAVGGKSVVDATLSSDMLNLEEVVVVGYGSQRRVTLTGSVASVSSKEIAKTPSTNITNSIAGLLPGVVTKNTSGEPGRDNNIVLIRGRNTTGNTDPLVVVDGVQGASGWERINSNDIESISVLKDASAAIYGARAANGVILITTKRGLVGKPTINYSFSQGVSQPTRLPKMASAHDFAEYVNQLDVEAGNSPRYTDEMLQKFADGSDPNYIDEDWYGTSLRKNVTQSQQNLSIRGGSEAIKYSVSGSYSNENGIFK